MAQPEQIISVDNNESSLEACFKLPLSPTLFPEGYENIIPLLLKSCLQEINLPSPGVFGWIRSVASKTGITSEYGDLSQEVDKLYQKIREIFVRLFTNKLELDFGKIMLIGKFIKFLCFSEEKDKKINKQKYIIMSYAFMKIWEEIAVNDAKCAVSKDLIKTSLNKLILDYCGKNLSEFRFILRLHLPAIVIYNYNNKSQQSSRNYATDVGNLSELRKKYGDILTQVERDLFFNFYQKNLHLAERVRSLDRPDFPNISLDLYIPIIPGNSFRYFLFPLEIIYRYASIVLQNADVELGESFGVRHTSSGDDALLEEKNSEPVQLSQISEVDESIGSTKSTSGSSDIVRVIPTSQRQICEKSVKGFAEMIKKLGYSSAPSSKLSLDYEYEESLTRPYGWRPGNISITNEML